MNRVSYSQIPQRVALRCFCQQNPTSVEKSLLHSFFVWKTSGGKLVATSFFYLMVHRWIADDVNIYLQFALKVTHHFKNADFDRFLLIVPQPWELAKKGQLSLIGSRQCAFNRAIDEPCALPLTPQRVAQNENFYPHDTMPTRVLAVVVCLSVCLSVCLPHAGIVSKRLNVGSRKQRHEILDEPPSPWNLRSK